MEEIKSMLHLDVMTVTGKTLGENLEELKQNGFYETCHSYLEKWNLKPTDVIRSFDNPIGTDGTVAVLRGNLAPEGSVVKHSAVPREMFQAVLKARPFDCEEDAIAAVLSGSIHPGDAVFIRYEGPKGLRNAGNVLYHGSHFFRSGAGKILACNRRPLFRTSQGSRYRPCFSGSRQGGPIALWKKAISSILISRHGFWKSSV